MAEGLLSTARRRWKGLMGDVESLSQGLGSGLASQVDSITGLIESPVETSRQMYQGVKALAQNPSVIPGLLRDAYQGATSGPMGFGEFVGANVGLRPRTPKSLLDMTVYHGSPHDFDRFDMSKIGTGEGAQAYGHGLYVAESPGVAKQYAATLGRVGASDAAGNRYGRYELASFFSEKLQASGIPRQAADSQSLLWADKFAKGEQLSHPIASDVIASKRLTPANGGTTYTVDLPDSAIANMLDWDAPLSQQPESVRKAIVPLMEKIAADGKLNPDFIGSFKGSDLINQDGPLWWALPDPTKRTPKAASEFLHSLGIPGIKYLDGGSRTMTPPTVKMNSGKYEVYWGNDPRPVNTFPTKEAAEAAAREIDGRSRNFVVFDDKLLKILKKE